MARQSPAVTLFLALISIGLVLVLVTHPETSFQAALRGLTIWWEVVFPALLPFIVVSEMLMGIGVVHFVGVLLEPLMRPLFNVPGTGGFVLTMGFASGYPVAAKLTARLREQGNVSRAEGERLVSFATTGDPLFVIGAVAVGFFHNERLGFVMAASHYLTALALGLLYRFHEAGERSPVPAGSRELPLLLRAVRAMHRTRVRDGRRLGRLMGDAVQSALHTLMMVGGFIILFSVLMQQLLATGLSHVLETALAVLLGPFGFPAEFSRSLITGAFEVTLGTQAASAVPDAVPIAWKAAVATALISWGGLSVHAQVASILSETDIRVGPYMAARAVHAVLSALCTLVFWNTSSAAFRPGVSLPVYLPAERAAAYSWWDILLGSGRFALALFAVLAIASWAASRRLARRRT